MALARMCREHTGALVAVLCDVLQKVACGGGSSASTVADPANSPHDLADDSLVTNLKPYASNG